MGLLQVSGVAGALVMGAIVDRRPITRALLAIAIGGSALLFVFLGVAAGPGGRLAVAVPSRPSCDDICDNLEGRCERLFSDRRYYSPCWCLP